MRLAFFGGSFDPFHNGHFAIVRALQTRDLCDRILLAPAALSPGKAAPRASGSHRLEMARLGVGELDSVTVTDLDLRRDGPSYTVHTLSALRRDRPGVDLILVVGADAWREFRSWRDPDRILQLARIIVFPRDEVLPEEADLPETVSLLEDFEEPVSSTDLRSRLAGGHDVSGLVPDSIIDYIHEHGLYAPEGSERGGAHVDDHR